MIPAKISPTKPIQIAFPHRLRWFFPDLLPTSDNSSRQLQSQHRQYAYETDEDEKTVSIPTTFLCNATDS